MRQFVILLLLVTISAFIPTVSSAISLTNNNYDDVNLRAKESIRKLADILDREIMTRSVFGNRQALYSPYYGQPRLYPTRMSPYTVLPIPSKRLHRIGGNIVMG